MRPLPGLNFGILADLILIVAPVRGLRPVRAARLPTWKVPNPTSVTLPPLFEGLFDGGHRRIERAACSCFRNIGIGSNLINQFGFVHCSPLVMEFNKQETLTSNAGAMRVLTHKRQLRIGYITRQNSRCQGTQWRRLRSRSQRCMHFCRRLRSGVAGEVWIRS